MAISMLRRWLVGGVSPTATFALIMVAAGALGQVRGDETHPVTESSAAGSLHQLQETLQGEAAGTVRDRREALQAALANPEAPNSVYWHSGYIRDDKQWKPVEAVTLSAAEQRTWEAYCDERIRAGEPTLDSEWNLAAWCHRHQMADQERMHLMRVLEFDPHHLAARQRLGHERVGDHWFSREEIREGRQESEELVRRLRKWMPAVKSMVADLRSPKLSTQREASERLSNLSDPGAIPALELAILQAPEEVAIRLLPPLIKLRTPEAAQSLSLIALQRCYSGVGEKALHALRGYPLEYYVPGLLKMVSTPITQQFILYENHNGMPALRQLRFRETRDRVHIDQLEQLVFLNVTTYQTDVQLRASLFNFLLRSKIPASERPANLTDFDAGTSLVDSRVARGTSEAARVPGTAFDGPVLAQASREYLSREIADQQSAGRLANASIEESAARIRMVLETATGQKFGDSPHAWWAWWYDHMGVQTPPQKARQVTRRAVQSSLPIARYQVRIREAIAVPQPGRPLLPEVPQGYQAWIAPIQRHSSSCFAAGTSVRTPQGMRPIEAIRPGDKVLSQRVATGELSYRPVMVTTVGPPTTIYRIATENGAIRATGGHLFWVSGKGWVRARELQAGQRLHTARGVTEVQSLTEEAEKEQTYNLIVPDFHTYCVGLEDVLVHDNTPQVPTDLLVPGLVARL